MLGEQIRKLRISYSKNQVELAKDLNVSKQTISNWENNNVPPSIDTLTRLAAYFNTSTDYLLEREHKRYIDVDTLTDVEVAHVQTIVNDIKRNKRDH